MTAYQYFASPSNLSALVSTMQTQHEAMRTIERGTAEPGIKPTGLLWNRTDYPSLGDAVVQWTGSAWRLILDPEFPALNAGGSVPLAADLPAGGHGVTGLRAAAANGEAVRYEQALLRDGTNAATANLNMGSHRITSVADPSGAQDAATKAYADAAVAGVQPSGGVDALSFAGFNASATISAGFVPRAVVLTMEPASGGGTRAFEGMSVAVALGDVDAASKAYGHNDDSANAGNVYSSLVTATPRGDGTVDVVIAVGHGSTVGSLKNHRLRWVAVP